jgi:hypothetical protein
MLHTNTRKLAIAHVLQARQRLRAQQHALQLKVWRQWKLISRRRAATASIVAAQHAHLTRYCVNTPQVLMITVLRAGHC